MECVQYIRVSSEEQSKGGSLGAQEREGGEYIKKMEFSLIAEFKDVETAKSSGREDFSSMLIFLKKCKKPVVLVVEKTDRLYRNYEDMVAVQKLVRSNGHEVHLYKEGEILNKETKSHTWLVHYFKVAMATNYVENLSEEIKKGQKQKILNGGFPHQAPFGYINDKNLRQIVIDEQAAIYVKAAFEYFATGLYSLQRLGRVLQADGFIYRVDRPIMPKAGLDRMLKNPFYIGEMRFNGDLYKGNHEPMIDKDTWLAAQAAFRKDGKPLTFNRQEFKYAHVLKCLECGNSIVGESKKGGRYVYYRCASRKQGCSQGYFKEAQLDEFFDNFIESLILNPEIEAEMLKASKEIGADGSLDTEIGRLEGLIKRHRGSLKKALHEKIEGTIDDETYKEVVEEYQSAIWQLEAKLAKIKVEDVDFYTLAGKLAGIPRTVARRWKEANTTKKIGLLNIIAANFYVGDEKLDCKLKEPLSLVGDGALCQEWWSRRDSNSRPERTPANIYERRKELLSIDPATSHRLKIDPSV